MQIRIKEENGKLTMTAHAKGNKDRATYARAVVDVPTDTAGKDQLREDVSLMEDRAHSNYAKAHGLSRYTNKLEAK